MKPEQDVERRRQLRSHIIQTLDVPQRIRLGPSFVTALLDVSFEHPADHRDVTPTLMRLSAISKGVDHD